MMNAASALQAQAPVGRAAWRITPLQLAVLLAVVAVAVRVVGIGSRPLWLDESYSAWFSARGWHYLWAVVPTYEPHPPFYYSLLKVWRLAFGGEAVALRGLSVLLGAATVPIVMAAANELERHRPTGRPLLSAGIAGFLAACSPMLVFLDQEARPYPLLIFAFSIATLGVLRLLREFSEGSSGNWRSWLLLGVGTEVGLWAHGLGILYAACLAVALFPAWLGRPLERKRVSRGLLTGAAALLLYAPCLAMILSRSAHWGSGWLRWEPSMLLQLLTLYTVPVEVLTVGSAAAALVMLLLLKRAAQGAFAAKGWNSDRALLVLWLGPPLLAAAISALLIPIFLPRTLAAALVPAYLAIGSALARTSAARERQVLAAVLCLTLVPTAVEIAIRPATEPWDQVSSYLSRHVAPGDKVWLYPNDSALPLEQAGASVAAMHGIPGNYPAPGIKGPIRAGSPAVVSLSPEQAQAVTTDPAIRNVPTVWLVTRQSGVFDPNGDVPQALSRVRRPGKVRDWGYIRVQSFHAR
jgi:uncharacterized membrane protein